MRKLKKEEMVSQMTMAVWLVFHAEHSTAAYDLKSEQRLGLGRSFCGLNDQHSRTYGLQNFIPLIKATQEPASGIWHAASGTSWFCQTPFGTSHGDEPQFITFYDTTNNLPVYSIYKVVIAWAQGGKRTNVLQRGGAFERATQVKTKGWNAELPSDEAFTNSRFDRGHLFADNYAQDPSQQKTT